MPPAEPLASAAATWDRLAPRYRAQERFEARAIEAAVRLAEPTPAKRLVDLATGTGLVLRHLASQRGQRPQQAIGVDRSPAMLARVGALPEGWSTILGDARSVPIAGGWADVVVCAYLLHLLDAGERRDVLAETRRLLRGDASARLVVVTVWADRRRPGGRLLHAGLELAARARPERWAGLRPLDPSAELRAAGFSLTRHVVLRRRCYPSLVIAATPSL